jgi:hypothetical protein
MDDRMESKTHSLSAQIIYPSIYAILQDNVHPVISDLSPENGRTVSASHSALSAIIKDLGKGVDESTLIMTLDGKRVDGEYDPDRDKLTYRLTKTLSSGKHSLTIQASDKAGNPAKTQTAIFFVK